MDEHEKWFGRSHTFPEDDEFLGGYTEVQLSVEIEEKIYYLTHILRPFEAEHLYTDVLDLMVRQFNVFLDRER